MADDDPLAPEARDEALASALAVEPLDEVTRRRLVSGALAASAGEAPADTTASTPGTARARVLGVAAAAVAFVVLGLAALTLPGSDSTDVASRAPTAASDKAAAAPSPQSPSTTPFSTSAGAASTESGSTTSADADASPAGRPDQSLPDLGLPDLGQLGDLSAPGSRRRVLTAATPLVDGVAPQRWSFTFQQCRAHTLDVVASGLGSVDGDPVQVFVSRRADGSLRVRALNGTTCELGPLAD